jgi:hypothetical protein
MISEIWTPYDSFGELKSEELSVMNHQEENDSFKREVLNDISWIFEDEKKISLGKTNMRSRTMNVNVPPYIRGNNHSHIVDPENL